MAVQIKDNGSFEILYTGPYKGLNVQAPPNLIDEHEAAAMSNFSIRNSAIQTRPPIQNIGGALTTDYYTAVGSFLDVSNTWRTFGITNQHNLLQLTNVPPPTWQFVANLVIATGTALPSWQTFKNTLFWVDGTTNAYSWTGAATAFNVIVVGGNATGAFYINSLGQHVLLAGTVEAGVYFPNRIRWSAIGLPTVFDPAVNINAGFNDFIDIGDALTGMMMLGRVGYLFHRTGIIEMSPTGVGTAPFDFNHVWNANDGVGNIYPYTVCQYGSVGAFASTENIYLVQNYQFSQIGGNSRDAIMTDLSSYFSIPTQASLVAGFAGAPQPIMAIVPGYANRSIYLTVQLILPSLGFPNGGGPTRIYQYSIENQSWEQFDIAPTVTGRPFNSYTAQATF